MKSPPRVGVAAAVPLIVVLAACAGAGGDAERGREDSYPSLLVEARRLSHPPRRDALPVDLDGDGEDDLVSRILQDREGFAPPRVSGVLLESHSGLVIEQVNYEGVALSPHAVDLDDDGVQEVVVPIVRNDSLFLSAVDGAGQKLTTLHVTEGEPRREPDGVMEWDPVVEGVHVADVDGDGALELLTVVSTQFAARPRGLFVHSLADGAALGAYLIGGNVARSFVGDFDGDGLPEVLLGTVPTGQGNRAGGFADDRAHLLVVEPADGSVSWSREVLGGWIGLELADFDADGELEVLLVAEGAGRAVSTQFEIIEPGSWRTMQVKRVPEPLSSTRLADLDSDAVPEILVMHTAGEVWALDRDLAVVAQRRVAPSLSWGIEVWPDADGDGVPEISTHVGESRLVLLSPDLRVKASRDGLRVFGVMHSGLSDPPQLVGADGVGAVIYRLQPNEALARRRLLAWMTWLSTAVGGSALLVWAGGLVSENRALRGIRDDVLDGVDDGLLVVGARGSVRWSNRTLRGWIGADVRSPRHVEDLRVSSAGLADLCSAAGTRAQTGQVGAGSAIIGGGESITVGPDRIPVAASVTRVGRSWVGERLFLVRLEPDGAVKERAEAWPIVGQRVAHSLKNPLTSILLTLRRLQIEYRERAPAVSSRLDRYTTRIEGGIEEMRRLTNRFLKFVDPRELELDRLDLERVLNDQADAIRRKLAPDIRFELKLAGPLPSVRGDYDQLQSALDNLVSNAVNALPEGGVITIAAHGELGKGREHDWPNGFVQIEVMDTGVGIPERDRERIFDPGYTTSEGGSGIGLAIVRDIIAQHGGEIRIEGGVGVGSVFCVRLPAEGGGGGRGGGEPPAFPAQRA